MNDDMTTDERNPMRLPFRTTEIAALLLVAVVLAGTFMLGGTIARRPLLADLASANATAAEAQDMAAEAVTAAQKAQDEVTGLSVRIEDAEAQAALSDDTLGNIIEKLDALGFKTTVSDEGTVTITAPKVTPQKAPAKKSGGVKATSYNTGGVEQWRSLTQKYFGANVNAALSVMRQESGGDPRASGPAITYNGRTVHCLGLFQIHPCHAAKFLEVTKQPYSTGVFNPEANIRFAAYMSAKGTNWSSWSVKPN